MIVILTSSSWLLDSQDCSLNLYTGQKHLLSDQLIIMTFSVHYPISISLYRLLSRPWIQRKWFPWPLTWVTWLGPWVTSASRPISSSSPSQRRVYRTSSVPDEDDSDHISCVNTICSTHLTVLSLQSQPCWRVRPSRVCLALGGSWEDPGSGQDLTPGLEAETPWRPCWGSWGPFTLPCPIRLCPRRWWSRPSTSSPTSSLPPHSTVCCWGKTCAAGVAASKYGM